MNTIEVINQRKTTRKFNDTKINEENLQKILKAGMQAPVGLAQYDSLHLTVVENKEIINKVGTMVSEMISSKMGKPVDKCFNEAVLIVLSSNSTMPGLPQLNAGCVLENMAIAATSLGIDSVIHAAATGLINNTDLKKEMNIEEEYNAILCISLGYAAKEEAPKDHTISVNRV